MSYLEEKLSGMWSWCKIRAFLHSIKEGIQTLNMKEKVPYVLCPDKCLVEFYLLHSFKKFSFYRVHLKFNQINFIFFFFNFVGDNVFFFFNFRTGINYGHKIEDRLCGALS